VAGQWFSPGTPVSSTNKTDHHDITKILLKVALKTITIIILLDSTMMSSDKPNPNFYHSLIDQTLHDLFKKLKTVSTGHKCSS